MLDTTLNRAATGPRASSSERELKFTLPAGRVPFARRLLDAVCRRDPQYPAADVWTVYYDTPKLESLGEKIDSDYLKLKIRLRWYSEPGGPPAGPVFMEAKRRVGTRREKLRVAVPYTAQELATWDLQDARLRSLPLLLQAQGMRVQNNWFPLLLLRYRRDRFIEPVSSARVSLDSDISAVAVNRTIGNMRGGAVLRRG